MFRKADILDLTFSIAWGVTTLLNRYYQDKKLHPVLIQLRTGMINGEVTASDEMRKLPLPPREDALAEWTRGHFWNYLII